MVTTRARAAAEAGIIAKTNPPPPPRAKPKTRAHPPKKAKPSPLTAPKSRASANTKSKPSPLSAPKDAKVTKPKAAKPKKAAPKSKSVAAPKASATRKRKRAEADDASSQPKKTRRTAPAVQSLGTNVLAERGPEGCDQIRRTRSGKVLGPAAATEASKASKKRTKDDINTAAVEVTRQLAEEPAKKKRRTTVAEATKASKKEVNAPMDMPAPSTPATAAIPTPTVVDPTSPVVSPQTATGMLPPSTGSTATTRQTIGGGSVSPAPSWEASTPSWAALSTPSYVNEPSGEEGEFTLEMREAFEAVRAEQVAEAERLARLPKWPELHLPTARVQPALPEPSTETGQMTLRAVEDILRLPEAFPQADMQELMAFNKTDTPQNTEADAQPLVVAPSLQPTALLGESFGQQSMAGTSATTSSMVWDMANVSQQSLAPSAQPTELFGGGFGQRGMARVPAPSRRPTFAKSTRLPPPGRFASALLTPSKKVAPTKKVALNYLTSDIFENSQSAFHPMTPSLHDQSFLRSNADPPIGTGQPSVLRSAMKSPARQVAGSPKKKVSWEDQETISTSSETGSEERPATITSKSGVLNGLVCFIDCKEEHGGEDQGHLFAPLLEDMGAVVLTEWTPDRIPTHVLFKDGSNATLKKAESMKDTTLLVSVAWAVDCDQNNMHMPERDYLLDADLQRYSSSLSSVSSRATSSPVPPPATPHPAATAPETPSRKTPLGFITSAFRSFRPPPVPDTVMRMASSPLPLWNKPSPDKTNKSPRQPEIFVDENEQPDTGALRLSPATVIRMLVEEAHQTEAAQRHTEQSTPQPLALKETQPKYRVPGSMPSDVASSPKGSAPSTPPQKWTITTPSKPPPTAYKAPATPTPNAGSVGWRLYGDTGAPQTCVGRLERSPASTANLWQTMEERRRNFGEAPPRREFFS